jgi:hypothetical protein
MNGEYGFSTIHERRERLLLVRRERQIAVDHHRVVMRELPGGQRAGGIHRWNELNAPAGQRRRQRREHRRRWVRRRLLPEEQHAQRPRFRFPGRRALRRRGARDRGWCRRRLRL